MSVQCFVNNPCVTKEGPNLYYVSRVKKKDNKFPRVLHEHMDFIEILLIFEGEGDYFIDNKIYKVKRGDLIILNSNIVHDEQLHPPNDGISIFCCAIKNVQIKGLRKNSLTRDEDSPVIRLEQEDIYLEILELYKLLFVSVLNEKTGYEIISHHLMMSLLTYILYRIIPNNKKSIFDDDIESSELAYQVKEYIDNNYMNEINLKVISEEMNVSQFYLLHFFKNRYGYSPIQYLLRRRIGEAQTLLLTTKKNITNIASNVGYDNNISNFNLIFKNKVGMSPSKYRKKFLNYKNKHTNLNYS